MNITVYLVIVAIASVYHFVSDRRAMIEQRPPTLCSFATGVAAFVLAGLLIVPHVYDARLQPQIAIERPVHDEPATVYGPPATMHRLSLAVNGSQSARLRFVASSIKDRVHLPSCSYVRQMEHKVEYESLDEAKADGKTPCSRCLGSHMALWGRE